MKKGKLENLDIYIPNNLFDSKCTEKQFNATALSCWLAEALSAENGVMFDSKTLTFSLGGTLTRDVLLLMDESINFSLVGSNGNGIFLLDDEGTNSVFIGSPSTNSGVNVYPDILNLLGVTEMNVTSDFVSFRNSSGQAFFTAEDGVGTIFKINDLYLQDLPIFADDIAAAALGTDQVYQTATGELRIKL